MFFEYVYDIYLWIYLWMSGVSITHQCFLMFFCLDKSMNVWCINNSRMLVDVYCLVEPMNVWCINNASMLVDVFALMKLWMSGVSITHHEIHKNTSLVLASGFSIIIIKPQVMRTCLLKHGTRPNEVLFLSYSIFIFICIENNSKLCNYV